MYKFETCCASIPGTDHTMPGKPGWKNNQDAMSIREKNCLALVVTDGCGSGKYSELGARVGAEFLSLRLSELSPEIIEDETLFTWHLQEIEENLLKTMKDMTKVICPEPLGAFVQDHLLFSILAAVITPRMIKIVSCGDGAYAIGDDLTILGPFPGNAPPYLGYQLVGSNNPLHHLRIIESLSADNCEWLTIGSDGVIDLFRHESLSSFRDDRYFSNSDALRRKLAVLNKETLSDGFILGGPLKDDTTLIIARRRLP